MTALMYSIMNYDQTHQDVDMIESLITEKVLNLEDKNGKTPLMIAKKDKHEDVFKLLIEYGALED
jgi:ankyrin repeat protein